MSEHVWLPITYTVSDRGYRKSRTHGVTVREDAPFHIRNAPGSEAKVVATVVRSQHEKSNNGWDSIQMPVSACEYRSYDERLYRQVLGPDGEPAVLDAIRSMRKEDGVKFGDYPLRGSGDPLAAPYRDKVEINEFQGDDRDIQIDAMNAIAKDLLVVDGILFRPTVEPVIELRIRALEPLVKGPTFYGISIHVLSEGSKHADDSSLLFRLDEMDAALALAEKWSEPAKKTFVVKGDVQDVDGSLLDNNFEDMTRSQYHKEMGWVSYHGFTQCGTTAIRTWCDAKDAMDRGDMDASLKLSSDFLDMAASASRSATRDKLGMLVDRIASFPKPEQDAISDLRF